jgi:hypothetical protein
MNAKDVIRYEMELAHNITRRLLDDLDDADLLVRTVPSANHIAWQLGHLISSEHRMIGMVSEGALPALPEGFADNHGKENVTSDDPAEFLTKDEYLALYDRQRQATLKALEEIPEARLDEPSPESVRQMFPTVGALFLLAGAHELLHLGQFTPVRRKLAKPIAM